MNKVEVKDCMGRTVIEYQLDSDITKGHLKRIEDRYGERITYSEKSPLYKLNVPHKFLLKGSVGSSNIVVTYKEKDYSETSSKLESLLEGIE